MKPSDDCAALTKLRAMISCAAVALMLLITWACSSRSDSKSPAEGSSQQAEKQNPAAAQSTTNPGINLQCVMDRIQNPRESFHYSYKKDSSNPVHQEADITPQTIDGFRVDIDGQRHPLKGERSDQQGWQTAWTGLMGISGMSSAVALINHSSAMKQEGTNDTNGYKTIHYSIDTARFDDTERKMLASTMGPGGFEKGDAWVTSEGCPVKLVLDDEMHKNDGSLLEKIHYEEAIEKK